MQSLNTRLIIIPLFIFLMLFQTTSHAAEPTAPDKAVVAQVIYAVIYQVKTVLIKRLAPSDVEKMINHARDMGATGYKLNHYSGGKMGWSMEDSKGREVYSVIFSFLGRQAKKGAYFGPLMSFRDAKVLHNWYRKVFSGYFKQIGPDKYDINDNCVASMELFKGITGSGRTIITVECH